MKNASKYLQVRMTSLKETKSLNEKEKIKKESILLKKTISGDGNYKILLDVDGMMSDSIKFSGMIGAHMDAGRRMSFYVGNYYGVLPEIKALFDKTLSLSMLTFNHEIALLLLTEQIYRAVDLMHGGKYHR